MALLNGQSDWMPMDTAPRDGTVIEVRCTYGVAPWYGLHKWVEDRYGRRWCDAVDDRKSVDEGYYLTWRPYRGAIADYVDPTNGAQNDSAYWRRAIAVKHGLRPDYFEPKPPTLWQRIFGIRPKNADRPSQSIGGPS